MCASVWTIFHETFLAQGSLSSPLRTAQGRLCGSSRFEAQHDYEMEWKGRTVRRRTLRYKVYECGAFCLSSRPFPCPK
jgi:hypothetical protein